MKKVILFPGQGSQYKGMGKGLFSKYAHQTKIASDILGYDLEDLCVRDPNRQLSQTAFTQPALFVVNHFFYQEQNQHPDFLIGHSLGEYNALLAAGVFDFETGIKLVQMRGKLMAAASGGGMAAVLGLDIAEVKEMLNKEQYRGVDIANYNTPTQVVLSGQQKDIDLIVKDFSEQQIRIIPLNVSAPFHSQYMKPAAEKYASFIKGFSFRPIKIPIIANTTARPYPEGQVATILSNQIVSSVQWVDSIRYLMGQGVSDYKEIGRGILTRMVNEIRQNCHPITVEPPVSSNVVALEAGLSLQTKNEASDNYKKTITRPTAVLPTNRLVSDHKDRKGNGQSLAETLGSAAFRRDYGIRYSYVAGAMYRGIASKELVVRMGKAGMLSYLGAAGMNLEQISENIDFIQSSLKPGEPFGANLIHHLTEPALEMKTVKLYVQKKVRHIEASAFMQMTKSLVYYHASGLERRDTGEIIRHHRILAKISRPEVAEAFMRPAPEKLLNQLLEDELITETQASLAKNIPVSIDICVEADSGGHTDRGVAMVLLPSIQRLRKELQEEYQYSKPIRIGLAGGIGTPQSAACAFLMGADFILTGSINQCTVEAGISSAVKDLLEDINVQDTAYAPAGDMFEIGAKVQVLRKGVLFPARANKLYNLYNHYSALEEIPTKTIAQLEKNYFKKPISEIWAETKNYFIKNGQKAEIKKAEKNAKHKMALVFRWYFGYSSRLAFAGDMDNKVNFQIHTGPSLGAFNQWVKGTPLESWRNRHVEQIGIRLMEETGKLFQNSLEKIGMNKP
jgi:trans-AT polyketide synthase/acyltransferase/oxidoreductase domain-containing protein